MSHTEVAEVIKTLALVVKQEGVAMSDGFKDEIQQAIRFCETQS